MAFIMESSDKQAGFSLEINKDILNARSTPAIAQAALGLLRQLVPCFSVFIGLFELDTSLITVLSSDGINGTGPQPGTKYPVGDYKNMEENINALLQGRTFIVKDTRDRPPSSEGLKEILSEGIRSTMQVPMLAGEEFILFLNLSSAQPDAFTFEHMTIAREVVDSLEERRHLARELHDRVGQDLTALGLNLNILRVQTLMDSKQAKRMDDSIALVGQVMDGIRNVMADLRPQVLDDLGLFVALKWYGRRLSERTGLAVAVEGEEINPRLSPTEEITLFRIAEESLINIAKHAHTSQATVRLEKSAGVLRLTIMDKGVGFEPRNCQPTDGKSGWGLLNMQERIESINGIFSVESAPGEGTRIVAGIRK